MRVVDQVLNHMDDKYYMAKGYSPLENLVHGLHMHEEWQKVSDAYKVSFNFTVIFTNNLEHTLLLN